MTNPVDPPLVMNLPPAPLVTDNPEQFDEKAFPFAEALDPWGQSLNALAQSTKTNALAAKEGAVDAQVSAANAAANAEAAKVAANMRGAWSELSGPLSPPATVHHRNGYWALLRPIANVAASEPGVSEDWAAASSVTDEILAVMHAINLAR